MPDRPDTFPWAGRDCTVALDGEVPPGRRRASRASATPVLMALGFAAFAADVQSSSQGLATGVEATRTAAIAQGESGARREDAGCVPARDSPSSASGNSGSAGEAMEVLRAADRNGDGRVSRSEFVRHQEQLFERMAKDSDGEVRLPRNAGAVAPPSPAGRDREDTGDRDAGARDAARRDAADPDRVPRSTTQAPESRSSTPSSTPSSSSPQEKKPGQR